MVSPLNGHALIASKHRQYSAFALVRTRTYVCYSCTALSITMPLTEQYDSTASPYTQAGSSFVWFGESLLKAT